MLSQKPRKVFKERRELSIVSNTLRDQRITRLDLVRSRSSVALMGACAVKWEWKYHEEEVGLDVWKVVKLAGVGDCLGRFRF